MRRSILVLLICLSWQTHLAAQEPVSKVSEQKASAEAKLPDDEFSPETYRECLHMGKYMLYSYSSAGYIVTVCSKDRKLKRLAKYQRDLQAYKTARALYDKIRLERTELLEKIKLAVADEAKRTTLQLEYDALNVRYQAARNASRSLPPEPNFHTIVKVGADFLAVETDEDQILVIPIVAIKRVLVEQDTKHLEDKPQASDLELES